MIDLFLALAGKVFQLSARTHKTFLFISLFLGLFSFNCKAQNEIKHIVPGKVTGSDTIPYVSLPTVEIVSSVTPEDLEYIKYYNRLKNNVLKVYPYAKWAGAKLREIETKSESLSKREKKRFVKEEEKKAKDQFEAELKNLTYSQGKILIKLIDRETGRTSYELVKELRGTIRAFLWQSMAKLFTADLKAQYDPAGEDRLIEEIVQKIERGELK